MINLYKRTIVNTTDEEYYSIMTREARIKKTYNYFKQYNRGEINPRTLKESKMFNSSDMHYLYKLSKKV